MSRPPRAVGLRLGLAFLAFVGLGLPDGLLGVAWPAMRATFALPLPALGPLLLASTSGYVVSSFVSGALLARMGLGTLLGLSCLATAASLAAYAAAPAWPLVVGAGVLVGLGAGAIDAGLNTYVATHHPARTLNWLHACYGLGTAIGPALMTAVLIARGSWRPGYALVAGAQLLLAATFAATRARWPGPAAPDAGASVAAPRRTLALPAAQLGIAAFFLYTGLEAVTGAWAYSLLTEARGVATETAGAATSAYWGGLMGGRVLFGFVAGRAPAAVLLRGCLAAALAGAALLAADLGTTASVMALVILGGAAGPMFPSLIAATPDRLGAAHAANGVGFQVAAAALGQSLLPWLVGVVAGRVGLEVVGPSVLVALVLLTAVHEVVARVPPAGHAPAVTGPPPARGAA
jgi:fucose permease